MLAHRIRHRLATAYAVILFAALTAPAYAAGSNMPWEQPLNQILDSIQGPVAKVISVIIIIITGLTLAFGETSGGFRRLIQIVFGLSIAFAAQLVLPVLLPVRRRSAGLMEHDEPVAGFYAPVHRALTEPILLGGAPRAVAIVNGTLAAAVGLGLRLWIVGGGALADRPSRRGLGRQARSRLRRGRAPASALPAAPGGVRPPMMNLAEYRRRVAVPRRLPALGGAGRDRASSSTRTARSSARRGFADPISTRRRRPSWSRSRRASTTRCAASAPAGRSSSRRSASRPTAIPRADFPDAASRLVDAERRAQFEEEGAHFESRYFLTLLWLPPADDAARAEAWLYEGRPRDGADWRAALAGFIDRTDRVLALDRGLHARSRMAR